MTGKALLRMLPPQCREVRQQGSHVRVECGECKTTVPVHAGEDLPPGTLRHIERDLERVPWGEMAAEVEMSEYKVVYDRDESGAWVAKVPSVPGCHSYGRTIEQARERVREALDLWVRDASTAYLVDEVRLPARLRATVTRARVARKKAEQQHERAQRTAAQAATELTRDLHVSLRDAGEVLGLSRQRIQQLTSRTPRKKSAAKRSVRKATAKSR